MIDYKKIKNTILNLLFPKHCLGCQTKDTWFCTSCREQIQLNKTQFCYLCGIPSFHGKTCQKHFHKKNPKRILNGLIVCAHYNGNPLLKQAIHALKYERHPEDIVQNLGKILNHQWIHHEQLFYSKKIHFIPIPLHPQRKKERGYNQAELLLEQIETSSTHHKKQTLLSRQKTTTSQARTKHRWERFKNMKEAFFTEKEIPQDTLYILVDDLCTTGATLEEACKALKSNGAKEVWGLVLARNR